MKGSSNGSRDINVSWGARSAYTATVADGTRSESIDAFIDRRGNSGGSGPANSRSVANELRDAPGVERPEPDIFGTLLEHALDEPERGRLGTHYKPRSHAERSAIPTIVEPLRSDWEEALAHAHAREADDDREGAFEAIEDFRHKLCAALVLDPARGTGNFPYVPLGSMKRLEGELPRALEDAGDHLEARIFDHHPRFGAVGGWLS